MAKVICVSLDEETLKLVDLKKETFSRSSFINNTLFKVLRGLEDDS